MTGVDIDADKVALLRRGEVPIAEPGLGELVNARLADGSLSFTTDLAGLATAEVVLLCVPTPVHSDGTTDLRAFDAAVETLSDVLDRDCVVVIKSTVPVGTTERTARALGRATVSNPEFLREGHAVHDFLNPDRIVIGATEATAADRVAALYEGVSAPVLRTEPASSELGKYASNAFLALKVSYVNVLTELSERLGAEVIDVAETMRLDPRIGTAFLSPGPGWEAPVCRRTPARCCTRRNRPGWTSPCWPTRWPPTDVSTSGWWRRCVRRSRAPPTVRWPDCGWVYSG